MLFAPRLLRYCFVPPGDSEASIRARFGVPYLVHVSDGSFRQHLRVRRRGGWTVPGRAPTDNVLIYTHSDGMTQLDIYYFIGPEGKLAGTFIGED